MFCMVVDIGQTKSFSRETPIWQPSWEFDICRLNLPHLAAIRLEISCTYICRFLWMTNPMVTLLQWLRAIGGSNKFTSSKDINVVYDFCKTGVASTPTPSHTHAHTHTPPPSHTTPNLMATSLVTTWSHVYSLQFILFNLIGKTNSNNIHLTRHISPGLICNHKSIPGEICSCGC